MSYDGKYTADPARISATQFDMKSHADEARSILSDFRDEVAAVRGWTGVGDDFALQAGEQFDRVVRTLGDGVDSGRLLFEAVPLAMVHSQGYIERTQQGASEAINSVAAQQDAPDTHGSSKH